MRTAILALAALALLGADPPPPAALDEAFFNGDRRAVLKGLADRLNLLKGGDARFMVDCGRAHLAAMDRPRALDYFKRAEAKEPKDGQLLRTIALAWLRHGYKTEALETYALVLARDPKNKEALAQCAVDLAEVGLVTEAEKHMNALAALEKEDWRAFTAFGRAFLVGGQRQKASFWFARAFAAKPKEEKNLQEILRAFLETQAVF
jgi:tetratricopeptide (TPR) repeat protein